MYIRRPRTKDPREVEKWEDDVSRQLNYLSSKSSQGIFIPGIDGEDGEEGIMGPPGSSGIGIQGPMGIPGRDGEDGEDAWIIPGIEISKVINLVYPVGSIYISIVATNPATLFGLGTWVAFGTGRILVGIDTGDVDFDTVEETGGAKTHKHSVDVLSTISGIPSATIDVVTLLGTDAVGDGTHTHNVDPAPVDSAIVSNVMPYIVVYMFKRTA